MLSKDDCHRQAKERFEKARNDFLEGRKAAGWVNLLAMSMCMAAIQGNPLKDNLEGIARDCGLIE